MERIDKILSRELNIPRSDAKRFIKSGAITVNNTVVKSSDTKCSDDDLIAVNGNIINAQKFVYIMMNKPKGVISASHGRGDKTVVDLVPEDMKRKNLFPAGRLDKDTTGFVLITDDGEFAHNILSPKKHIDKTYIAKLDKPFDENVISDFENGMLLNDEKLLKAKIEAVDGDYTLAKVVIKQGLYHQIKRMFKKHGITVLELDRIAMGSLPLDKNLAPGECRYITDLELSQITQN